MPAIIDKNEKLLSKLFKTEANFKKAELAYEQALISILERNIPTRAHFIHCFDNAITETIDRLVEEPAWAVIGEKAMDRLIYKAMLEREICCLRTNEVEEDDI
jgi:hypothetical protein